MSYVLAIASIFFTAVYLYSYLTGAYLRYITDIYFDKTVNKTYQVLAILEAIFLIFTIVNFIPGLASLYAACIAAWSLGFSMFVPTEKLITDLRTYKAFMIITIILYFFTSITIIMNL